MSHATPGRTSAARRIAALIVIVVSVVVAASCAANETVPIAEPATVGPATIDAVPVSPLEQALGIASNPDQRRRQLVGWQQQADAALVACMAEHGFFYAVDPAAEFSRLGIDTGDGTRAWAEVNGFGITTSVIAVRRAAARTEAASATANLAYVASLTTEQAREYDRALIGDLPPGSDQAEASFAPAGCWGAAYREMLVRFAHIDEFGDELDSLNARFASDPRVARLDAAWSICMQTAGFDYMDRAELIDSLYARLVDLDPFDDIGELVADAQPAVDAVLVDERAAAVASFDCSLPFASELRRLRNDYEQEFLDDNRFRIEELVGDS